MLDDGIPPVGKGGGGGGWCWKYVYVRFCQNSLLAYLSETPGHRSGWGPHRFTGFGHRGCILLGKCKYKLKAHICPGHGAHIVSGGAPPRVLSLCRVVRDFVAIFWPGGFFPESNVSLFSFLWDLVLAKYNDSRPVTK